eukprot:CAMPEP_0170548214 /NCGR_PEP_ID=MMETSP0211-20121228/6543_1 /TAXON_ID=311385 /ORGANISM="Pseudokeronopsis sp., Strain OXSARD2" /LENGTH=47 /DNA_ID= /DNA_START= /DNA_END= /DNA_ORIENTATION=
MKEVLKLDKAAIKPVDFNDQPNLITRAMFMSYRSGVDDYIMKFKIKE